MLGKELRGGGGGGGGGYDLTAGSRKAAQMSVEEDLARGGGEGGGSYRNTEAARRCDEPTSAEVDFDN